MTQHDDKVRLQHMLAYARKSTAMIQGRTREELNSDEMLSLALTRVVEIIGEAAARVSPVIQQNHTSIPCPQIIGLRNRLVHGYDMELGYRPIQIYSPREVTKIEKD